MDSEDEFLFELRRGLQVDVSIILKCDECSNRIKNNIYNLN